MTITDLTSDLAAAVVRLAQGGVPVFPLQAGGKAPAIPGSHPPGHPCKGECGRDGHGFHDATTDLDRVRRWWAQRPQANIGVPTGPASNLLVVDLDGDQGLASWARLEAAHGPLSTLQQTTGRGLHLLLTYPDGATLGNTSGRLGRGIDTRGAGGYIAVAPSIHPNGRQYRWVDPTVAPAPCPRWLVDLLHPPPRPAVAGPRRQPGGAQPPDRSLGMRPASPGCYGPSSGHPSGSGTPRSTGPAAA